MSGLEAPDRPTKLTEGTVTHLLRQRHTATGNGGSGEYAFLAQVRNAAGFDANRSFDAMAMSLWPSRGLTIDIFEIKVTRSDWQRELKKPDKAEDACRVADRFWIVAPTGCVKDGELPPTWGLIEITGDGTDDKPWKLRTKTQAPHLHKGDRRRVGIDRGLVVGINTHLGAPPLDHWWHDEEDVFVQDAWLIPTEAYPGSHYATWPRKLLKQPILSMCPREVCTKCGEPRRRITQPTANYATHCGTDMFSEAGRDRETRNRAGRSRVDGRGSTRVNAEYDTVGWTDCGCNAPFRRGHVLDPFAGSGTTAVVATGLNRDCTLIDIDQRNVDLARERVGMFLHVPEHEEPAA